MIVPIPSLKLTLFRDKHRPKPGPGISEGAGWVLDLVVGTKVLAAILQTEEPPETPASKSLHVPLVLANTA